MKMRSVSLPLILSFIALSFGCAKDRSKDDFLRDKQQESLERMNAVSGSYGGAVISKIDGTNLGYMTLNFRASTDLSSSSQNAIVSGSITIKSLSTTEITFNNGQYDDQTGNFQVKISVAEEDSNPAIIFLNGHITANQLIGYIEVIGQAKSGAQLQLQKNAQPANTSSMEVGGIRLEQIKKNDYIYEGIYRYKGGERPLKLTFTKSDLPAQNLHKLLSPVRKVSINLDFSGFDLNFSNARLDDNNGKLVGDEPTNQQGRPTRASLSCTKFSEGDDFGWDCELQTKNGFSRTRLSARK